MPVWAQKDTSNTYPQGYFRNPLDIPILLAGNFGECRPGHFHSGIDIKTNGVENLPVYAVADGYISRIKTEKGGFGHAIYITHPNGYTTLYAHLNDYMPALQKFLRAEQYKQEHWNVDVTLSPDKFPVKQGQQIAWSGNTGASTAPHLHFEIRNSKTEHPLSPQLFGLPITDAIAPIPKEIAVYNMSSTIYEQEPKIISVAKRGNVYRPAKDTIYTNNTWTGIGININDFMDGSTNTLAYYAAKVYMDDSLQTEIHLDDIGYDETRYVNAYADYKTKELQGKWIQCLFKLPGNRLNTIYKKLSNNNGALSLTDKLPHRIRIDISDDYSNTTTIAFVLAYNEAEQPTPCMRVFGINKEENFSDPNIAFTLSSKALYDSICFKLANTYDVNAYSERYEVHKPYIPLHSSFDLRIKPNKAIPFAERDKVVMMYSDGKSEEGSKATAEGQGWYKSSTRAFGTYWLVTDTKAPTITPAQKNGANLAAVKRITFTAKDDKTSVKTFKGLLDGKWICFEQHGNTFFYTFDEHCPKGKHELVFSATDENDNTQTIHFTFTR